ncbi:MAG: hypothetical protein Q4E67_06760, partial [Planctomycetia bacterium]|nr:hypothetical protein [Planctomycetia bacterium]
MRWVVVLFGWLGMISTVSGSVTFDWNDVSQGVWNYREGYFTGDEWMETTTISGQPFPTAPLTNNGFFWTTESNSLMAGYTAYSEMAFSQSGITVTAYGGASGWENSVYSTTGIGVSSVFLDTASAEYQNINLGGYGPTFRLRDTVSVLAQGDENQNFLCIYAPGETDDIYSRPTLKFNQAVTVESLDFANAAYTYKAIQNESSHANPFPEKFGVNIYALDENLERISEIMQEVVLSAGDSVVDDWLSVALEGF